ncbi:MAG: hypothetical protein ACOX5W_00245 [Bacillota bacterium]|jgi:hypothetical protein
MNQPAYKEMQQIIKQVAREAMLDKSYRELCLTDSRTALQIIIDKTNSTIEVPDNIFFQEEDGESLDSNGIVYILPPFLKPSWLLNS